MPKNVKKTGVHMIYKDGVPVGFFYREEKSNENIVFTVQKAALEDMEELFTSDDKKV
jgi:hypothetical protein